MSSWTDRERIADGAAPLDTLLIDAALGPLRRFTADASRITGPRPGAPPAGDRALTARPGAEAGCIAIGTSTVAPNKRDRRFNDKAWTDNPLLRRLVQLDIASRRAAEQLLADAGLDWRDEQRLPLSPSNIPLVNPASAKAAIDTGGASLLRGGLQLVKDLASSPRTPNGRQVGLRARRLHRCHPWSSRVPDRGVRAHPVRSADRRGLRGARTVLATCRLPEVC